ncbi:MAG: alanine--tRNA ligase [Caldisericia bacterium]|nr:alanine--tRNA ligase [Caldisericia bacterium]
MKTNTIRGLFLDYFKHNEHRIIDSAPLPIDDPTLLFTVAGMVPLKKYYLGESTPISSRMASSQKCLRTNDIENVGRTPRHHTFFEMLGNFSIGDYFKQDAIEFGWEFISKTLNINSKNIWVTVYPEDIESKQIWRKMIPESHIIDSKDNFWQMADVGPCGFDSEIFVDLGENIGCKTTNCNPLCECGRFLEIWNLVFMEFNLEKNGSKTNLPRKNIDTGMGLERISCVMNNVQSNYDTDLFIPIIEEIEKLSGKSRDTMRYRYNVIADHVRAMTFLIADGVFPENSKHGYVLRRLIRRAKLAGHLLGIKEEFLSGLCQKVIKDMAEHYSYLEKQEKKICLVVSNEEEQFSHTLEDGYKIFIDEKKSVSSLFPGDVAFKLHDTFGFPVELTRELLTEDNLLVDEAHFASLLEDQKTKSKAVNSFSSTISKNELWVNIKKEVGSTDFLGFDRDATAASIRAIVKDEINVDSASINGERYFIVTGKTPLYPEKGGPIGDQGTILSDSGKLKIVRTLTPIDGLIVHEAVLESGSISVGEKIQITVDVGFRRGIKRAHTATHLIHAALKKVVGDHVNQAGSLIEPDSLRFDFNTLEALTEKQIFQIEDVVNDWIAQSDYVKTEVQTLKQAVKAGATALFKEKYGDSVRVVQIQNISKELCGGLHVSNTSELRMFSITKESSIGSNLRRIEAVVGDRAIKLFRTDSKKIREIEKRLEKPNMDILEAVDSLKNDLKSKDKEIKVLRSDLLNYLAKDVLANAEEINEYLFANYAMKNINMELLRKFADIIRKIAKKQIVIFVSSKIDLKTIAIIAGSGEKNCRELFKTIQSKYSLRGGGNPKLISIGDVNPDEIGGIVNLIREDLKN